MHRAVEALQLENQQLRESLGYNDENQQLLANPTKRRKTDIHQFVVQVRLW